tara:strand:+ start:98 stop:700 length:603 start_codon:yes stop_codon:yes gene_type:complete
MKSISDELRVFAAKVIREARNNIQKDFRHPSGNLANSMTSGVNVTKDNTTLIFWMNEYGIYKDAGVFGAMKSSTDKMEWAVKNIKQKGKDTNSVFYTDTIKRFSYKDKAPKMESLEPYIKRNNIRFRTPKGQKGGGQYRKGSYQTIAYWMAQRIYAQGLAPTLFFTKPFLKYFTELPDGVARNYASQIEEILKQKLEKNG